MSTQHKMITTEDIIQAALKKYPIGKDPFRAKRGERIIWAGSRRVKVRTPGEKILYLPNGVLVRITTDASGVATQIEETESLHAIARPRPIDLSRIGRSKK